MKPPTRHAHPLHPELAVYGQELEPCDFVQEGDVHCGVRGIESTSRGWQLIPLHLAGKPSWACVAVTQSIVHVRPSADRVEGMLAGLGSEHQLRDGWDQHVLSQCEPERGDDSRGVAFFATVVVILALMVAACVWWRVTREAPLELRIEIERGRP